MQWYFKFQLTCNVENPSREHFCIEWCVCDRSITVALEKVEMALVNT